MSGASSWDYFVTEVNWADAAEWLYCILPSLEACTSDSNSPSPNEQICKSDLGILDIDKGPMSNWLQSKHTSWRLGVATSCICRFKLEVLCFIQGPAVHWVLTFPCFHVFLLDKQVLKVWYNKCVINRFFSPLPHNHFFSADRAWSIWCRVLRLSGRTACRCEGVYGSQPAQLS